MKSIAVHNGKFHADDVFAVAILKMIYPKIKVIRTRDPLELKKADARIDVGGKYDHDSFNYDHHQAAFKEKRPNGIPYASAGLIWKHYGEKLANSKAVWKLIEDKIIQYIDADDNGIRTHESKKVEPYTLREIIISFNPEWPDKSKELFDKNFNEVVSIAIKILQKEIELAEKTIKASSIIKKKILDNGKEYLILDENMPFQDIVREESKKIKYVIKQDPSKDSWAVIGIKKGKNNFEVRKEFPRYWAGLTDKALEKITNVKDAVFCHKKLFIAIAKSKRGAIKLAELALKN